MKATDVRPGDLVRVTLEEITDDDYWSSQYDVEVVDRTNAPGVFVVRFPHETETQLLNLNVNDFFEVRGRGRSS